MAAAGQVLVPTLPEYYWMAGLGEDVIDPVGAEADPDMPPVLVELAQRNIEEGAASMRAARQAGVKIALGSDTSLTWTAGPRPAGATPTEPAPPGIWR